MNRVPLPALQAGHGLLFFAPKYLPNRRHNHADLRVDIQVNAAPALKVI